MVAICGLDGVRIKLKLGLGSKFNHVQTSNFKNFKTIFKTSRNSGLGRRVVFSQSGGIISKTLFQSSPV